eukprot:2645175-Alexandrium_andersonii.AAC.1
MATRAQRFQARSRLEPPERACGPNVPRARSDPFEAAGATPGHARRLGLLSGGNGFAASLGNPRCAQPR